MNFNKVFFFIAITLSVLSAYILNIYVDNNFKSFNVISGSIITFFYSLFFLVLENKNTRKSILTKTLSSVFILLHFIILYLFSYSSTKIENYIIFSTILIIVFIVAIYSVLRR